MADTQRTPASPATRFDFLTGRVPGLFLVAALLFAVFAFSIGREVFAGAEPAGFAGAFGWFFAFLGLLGIYPVLVERAEGWAKAGAVFAGLGAIGSLVATLGGTIEALSAWSMPGVLGGIATVLIMIGIIPGFGSMAIASLRAGVLERGTSLWLFGPAAVFLTNMLSQGIFARLGMDAPAAGALVLSSLMTLAHFANFLATRRSDRLDLQYAT